MAFDATAALAPDLLGLATPIVADAAASTAGLSLGDIAGIGAAAQGAGSILGAGASLAGANKIAGASNNAIGTTLGMFNTQNAQQAPYRTAGYSALGQISSGLGMPGVSGPGDANGPLTESQVQALYQHYLGRQAGPDEVAWQLKQGQTAAQMEAGMPTTPEYVRRVNSGATPVNPLYSSAASVSGSPSIAGSFNRAPNTTEIGQFLNPAMAFGIGQGVGAVTNLNNASGGALGGNTLKAITDYATNSALNQYWTPALNTAFANQTNIFNRLSTVAGFGQTANQTSANLTGTIAPTIGNIAVGSGAAQAAGTVGAASNIAQGANNAMGWYALPAIMNAGQPQPAA